MFSYIQLGDSSEISNANFSTGAFEDGRGVGGGGGGGVRTPVGR